MCEFLVVLNANLHPAVMRDAPRLNAARIQRGEIITAQDDGWSWGAREHGNGDWLIIKVPGLDAAKGRGYVARQPGHAEANPLLRARSVRLNLDHPTPAAQIAALGTDRRFIQLSAAQFRALIEVNQTASDGIT